MSNLSIEEKIQKISDFIKRLNDGESVPKRELANVLDDEELQDIDETWKNRSDFNNDQSTRPSELDQYVKYLSKADRLSNLGRHFADKYHNDISKRSMIKKRVNQVDGAFETALECLQEILDESPGIASVLDRSVSFEHGHSPEITSEGMPRWIGSKSFFNQGGGMGVGTKQDVKRETLEKKLSKLRGENEQEALPEGAETPKERIARLKAKGII